MVERAPATVYWWASKSECIFQVSTSWRFVPIHELKYNAYLVSSIEDMQRLDLLIPEVLCLSKACERACHWRSCTIPGKRAEWGWERHIGLDGGPFCGIRHPLGQLTEVAQELSTIAAVPETQGTPKYLTHCFEKHHIQGVCTLPVLPCNSLLLNLRERTTMSNDST